MDVANEKQNTKVTEIVICVDDICPVEGKGLRKEFDEGIKFMKKLNDEFGCKFSVFTIPKFEGKEENDLRNHPDWCKWVKEQNWLEVCNHGLTHKGALPEYGAQEFLGIHPQEQFNRLAESRKIFQEVGFDPKTFRSPGWYVDKNIYVMIKKLGFKAIADHAIGNKTFELGNGLKVIPYTLSIDNLHSTNYSDLVILHSHIDSDNNHNKNYWNNENYEKVRLFLNEINERNRIEYRFLSEII